MMRHEPIDFTGPEPRRAADPTQVARPWRAALRTGLQTLLALMLALPAVAAIVSEVLPGVLPDDWLAAFAGFAASVSAVAVAITRIMLVPAISDVLTRWGIGPAPREVDEPLTEGTDA